MIIDGAWKNKVRMMRANGDSEGAIRELRKFYIVNRSKLELYTDKYFVLFALAHLYYKKKDYNMSNYYLEELFRITTDDIIRDFEKEYHNITWLNINVNHDRMACKEILNDMLNAYHYYNKLGEQDIALSALENIFYFEGNSDKILESLEALLQCEIISDWNFITSILDDCENMNHNLYIKALNIVSKYNININVV